jgi:DNA gyrase/topoisomerase IV subunit A
MTTTTSSIDTERMPLEQFSRQFYLDYALYVRNVL